MNLSNIRRQRQAIERSLCIDSLRYFFVAAWPHMEPTIALLPSVAIDGMCAAGQALAEGRIKRLANSTCPGTSKSLFWSVAFPAWIELREGGRERIMVGSYAWAFATRDSRRCRDLMQTDWYRSLVDGEWEIREDANRNDDFWTTTTGRRLITSVEGKSTGERCSWQIMDDTLSAADALSTSAKAEAVRWVNQVLPSRLQDQRTDPRVMVGQRLAVDDTIAEAIRQGWPYLYLPAVLGPCPELGIDEETEPCELRDDAGELIWRDPRAPGEHIVELLDIPALVRLKQELGSSAFAAQYLQRPADDSSALIRRAWWRFHGDGRDVRPAGCDVELPVVDTPDRFDRITIAVDLTFGSVTGDYAVCSAWGAVGPDRYLLAHWRKRAGFEESLAAITQMARDYPSAKVLVEKAANGAASIEMLRKKMPNVVAQKPIGKKMQRLGAIAPTVESGHCYLPLGMPGLADFVEELAGATKHDDQCDVTAYAVLDLNSAPMRVLHGGLTG